MDQVYEQRFQSRQAELEHSFVKEMQKVRTELSAQHQEKLENVRRMFVEGELHQMSTGVEIQQRTDLVTQLQTEKQVLLYVLTKY